MRACPVCGMQFAIHDPLSQVSEEHIQSHFTTTKDCPVCGERFSSDTDQGKFEEHVCGHFKEDGSPQVVQ